MLEKDASYFNVISTASLWDLPLWLQCGEGMWACVIIESTCVNVFSHRTYYNTLFIVFFSQVSSRDEGSETHGPKQATSGSITGRPGAIRWKLSTRLSHLIVSETLCLSSTATLWRCSITFFYLIVNVGRSPGESNIAWHRCPCIITIASGH